ncbi:hypothetical protein RJ639_016429 [Escallonia herrerae]|uniref:Uncharacterized protein n=1 Tax=Escallonia herrerae TaxID=1293975 RepID=A0AA88VAQ9_9ASTE|nr:hypothetical protein RJ639_016429 [Escallonia herrerae]
MKAMESLHDLIEEAKIRTVWWALCIFSISYFLTHTSKSMWMNIPISVLVVCGLRILFTEVEFRWKVRNVRRQTYLSHLEKKQLSPNDSRLSTLPPPPKWKRKIDSPVVEAAMEDFISKILQDFVVDLWYSDITPDREAPKLIHSIIMDVLGEISGRVKNINLVDLLTRDVVDLVGEHLDLFRRNQTAIGVDVMKTLSSEERDERLKHHLLSSQELHPALISPECEYKVLQRLMGGVLAIVLRPREAQCPLVRCIARELLTCLVMQPVMNFASPGYINELIEYILLAVNDEGNKKAGDDQSHNAAGQSEDWSQKDEASSKNNESSHVQGTDMIYNARDLVSLGTSGDSVSKTVLNDEPVHTRPAEWARILEAATQRRTEVLMPENLENMWTKGRNYKKKAQKNAAMPTVGVGKDLAMQKPEASSRAEDKALMLLPPRPHPDSLSTDPENSGLILSQDINSYVDDLEDTASTVASGNIIRLRRSNSTSDLNIHVKTETTFPTKGDGPLISEFYTADFSRHEEVQSIKSSSDIVLRSEGQHVPKLKCRVIGAYFEKLGSKSFAVYSIAVTDADQNTWFVKRRYRNFERLHRQLKEIPNYTLHLPPKRIFSSSTEDAFVHQRCIQLDKYLQDLLSIANVAEQHEVWDFLSVSSKNYSFGKSSSVMRTLAVNVDDAVDDIVRQFKGVSDGLMRKVVGSSSVPYESASLVSDRNLSWNSDEISKLIVRQNTADSAKSFSDMEEGDKDGSHDHKEIGFNAQANGWHSDNELNAKGFPPRIVAHSEEFRGLDSGRKRGLGVRSRSLSPGVYPAANFRGKLGQEEDPYGVPPEWTPPNLSVPVLNLVDNIFQLKRRGWLRRQVFWISKQILQLMMEDAIDDWLLRQIHWLRRDDIISQGIRWVQDVLWPDGKFFLKLNSQNKMDDYQSNEGSFQSTSHLAGSKVSKPGSFEQQLEAARRASYVKKMMFSGAPTTLVSLIGHKQYRRCARDMYYFLQSTICLKQLAYGILELVIVSLFPELRDLVLDVHRKMRVPPL